MTAPEDYDRDRRHKTYGEVHRPDREARERSEKRKDIKRKNRQPGHFGKANWEAYQHHELYNMIMKADPRQMYDRAQHWKRLADEIETTTTEVQKVVEQVMTSWQGQAAVNAGSATSRLMQWAGTASHTAGSVAENMSTYSDTVATAQRRMPPPSFATAERRFRDGYTVMTTGGPADAVFLKQLVSDGMVSHEQARANKAEAVNVMENYEQDSRGVHDKMPHFEDAGPTTKDSPTWAPASTDPSGGGAGAGGGSGSPGGFPPGGVGAVPGGNSSTTPSSFAPPAATAPTGPGGGFPPGSTGFGPGNLNGGADQLRGGGGFGAFGPGVPGAGGVGAGASAGALGPGALAGRGPGGAVIGGPGGMAAGAAGARGGMGAMGGMPFGAGANGEEDGEHTNKYDEGLDLFDD
ncbi:MAG TPA: PPE domain-containing protein, partial [Actinophytocola sp.]|nr:PPE domain-containing protein [Actinophytocola sp.]